MNDIEEAISYIKNTKKHLLHLGETWYADYLDDAIELLKEQETANVYKCQNCGTWVSAENVVRCKDCNNGVIYCDNGDIICDHVDSNGNDTHPADWFCSDGERKSD